MHKKAIYEYLLFGTDSLLYEKFILLQFSAKKRHSNHIDNAILSSDMTM